VLTQEALASAPQPRPECAAREVAPGTLQQDREWVIMAAYIVRRMMHGAAVLFGVTLIVFFLIRLSGDPAAMMLPIEASPQDLMALRHKLGLDRHKAPALPLVVRRLPATLNLILAGLVGSVCIAVPIGIVSALKKDSVFDNLGRVVAIIGSGMPTFWLGILLIMAFSVRLRWLPFAGSGSIKHLILPAVTLGAFTAPLQMRVLRSSLLEVLGQDYIRTAYSKGLTRRRVLFEHALKNAAIPYVTVVGLQIGAWLGGSIITESVFAYPGMGLLAVNAILDRDLPLVQAYVFVVATGIVILNFCIDLIYVYLDPRVRHA
jgi:ABC-type dipeptide/oligopeptide/nickel transport system permease component